MGQRYTFDRNKTYTFEEVRPVVEGCLKDRAKYLGHFYKVMPRDLFDKYAKEALWNYGKARDWKGEMGSVKTMVDFLTDAFVSVGCTIGAGVVAELDEDANKALLIFEDGCALVDGWREMGLTDDEIDYLCKVACYGDYGQSDSFGLKCSFNCTMTDKGCNTCEMVLEPK